MYAVYRFVVPRQRGGRLYYTQRKQCWFHKLAKQSILTNNKRFLLLRFIFRVSVVEDLKETLESTMSNLRTAELTLLKPNRCRATSLAESHSNSRL